MTRLAGGLFGSWVLAASALCGCSGSDAGSNGAAAGLLGQAPHCSPGTFDVRIEGNVGDGAIADTRTSNSNAGLSQLGSSEFKTPFIAQGTLPDSALAITLDWSGGLAFGQTGPVTSGKFSLPATHPLAGQTWCILAAQVGFVKGGAEDGVFKFAVTSAAPNADCSGAATPVDIRGCFD